MRRLFKLMTASLVTLSSGCALYPLPQDVSGATTEDIVANVRCQARRAVRHAFRKALEDFGNNPVARVKKDGVAKIYTGTQLLHAMNASEIEYKDLKIENFIGIAKNPFNYYATTQVAYEFTLQGKENNTQGISIDLIRQFLRRADKIGISVTSDRTRDVSRTFTVQDSFFNLATNISRKYCEGEWDKNIIFPLSGRMPIYDLVRSYITINEFNVLTKIKLEAADYVDSAIKGTETGPSTPQMADTIIFTTKFIGKNEPTIEYNPVGAGLSVASLGFTNNNSREDMHKVIVTVTTSEVDKVKLASSRGYDTVINPSPEKKRQDALDAIKEKRVKDFQDAVIGINNNLSRLGEF